MATEDDVRRAAVALPEVVESTSYGEPAWEVRGRAFAWERPLSRADREALGDAAPDGYVLAVRVADLGVEEALLATEAGSCFTTPHFEGHPAVLIRLDLTGLPALEELLTDAWLAVAPERLAAHFLRGHGR